MSRYTENKVLKSLLNNDELLLKEAERYLKKAEKCLNVIMFERWETKEEELDNGLTYIDTMREFETFMHDYANCVVKFDINIKDSNPYFDNNIYFMKNGKYFSFCIVSEELEILRTK